MDYIYHFFIGIIQGFTEFLPVSSSGHLVIFQEIIGFNSPKNSLEIIAHFGTLMAIFIYFRDDIIKLSKGIFSLPRHFLNSELKEQESTHHYLLSILIATIPTAIIGLFQKQFEKMFDSMTGVAVGLFLTSIILILSRFRREKLDFISLPTAFIIGVAQAIAIVPGISRSGTTIVIALLLGVKLRESFKFSFLISIPAILGASILKFSSITYEQNFKPAALFLLLVTATISGYIALRLLNGQTQLDKYARYTLTLAIFTTLWQFFS